MGVQTDLFPLVVSAANGKLGGAIQGWYGIRPLRMRLILAHLEPPDSVVFLEDGFRDWKNTVVAGVVDYTFGDHFDHFWISTGFEWWHQSVGIDNSASRGSWESAIYTLGCGYTWRFYKNFYLDPWVGMHVVLNPQTVAVESLQYDPFPVIANASVKLGWFWDFL
jgi:hypothetical protein